MQNALVIFPLLPTSCSLYFAGVTRGVTVTSISAADDLVSSVGKSLVVPLTSIGYGYAVVPLITRIISGN